MFGLTRCVTRLQVIKLGLLDFMDSWTSCPAHGDSRKASAGLTRGVLKTLQVRYYRICFFQTQDHRRRLFCGVLS